MRTTSRALIKINIGIGSKLSQKMNMLKTHEKYLGVKIHNKQFQEELKSANDEVIRLSEDLSSKDGNWTKHDDKIIELKRVDKIIKACKEKKRWELKKDELSDNSTAHEHELSKVYDKYLSHVKHNKSYANEEKEIAEEVIMNEKLMTVQTN